MDTEISLEKRFALIQHAIEELVPIHKALGLEVSEITEKKIILKIPFTDTVIGDMRTNRWHGGILSLAMDVAGGMAGVTTFTSFNDRITTVDIRVDYLAAPSSKDLYIEGEIVRLGNRIMVSKMKAYHKDNSEVLAEGKGVYYILKESSKKK